ncbi:MAG: transcriptional regulator [Pyrinomonadaceae bacterium]
MDTAKQLQTKALYRFDTFTLDMPERRLWRGDEALQLTPKQFDLLLFFVENAGRTIKKDELLEAVWPDTYVEENTLARNVSWLRKLLETDGSGRQLIETVPKVGYRFTADGTYINDKWDTLIVEEQIVQHVRATETITINEALQVPASPGTWSRLFTSTRFAVASLLLIACTGLVLIGTALTSGNGVFAEKEISPHALSTGLNVRATTTVKNIQVDAARLYVDTGIDVIAGDTLRISAMGVHRPSPEEEYTFAGNPGGIVTDHVFPEADRGSLIASIRSEGNKEHHFQVSRSQRVDADVSGTLYLTINDFIDHYSDNRGGLIVSVVVTRNYSIIAEDDDLKGAWGKPLVELRSEDELGIAARGDVAYWQGGELYDLDGSDHKTDGYVATEINARCLMGKIGDGNPFKVGKNFPLQTAGSDGKLFLTVNDTLFGKPGSFKNNSGELNVDIEIVRRSGDLSNPL